MQNTVKNVYESKVCSKCEFRVKIGLVQFIFMFIDTKLLLFIDLVNSSTLIFSKQTALTAA